MAKFQPMGLEWQNKGLKDFLAEIKKVTKAMEESSNEIAKKTLSMKNLNKETGEWVKRTVDIVAGAEGVTETFTTMTRGIKDAGEAIVTTDRTTKMLGRTAESTGRRSGGIGILTAAISGLAAAAGVFLLNALKNLIQFGLKVLVQALILPLRAARDLAKLGFKLLVVAGKGVIEIFKGVANFGKNVLGALRDIGATAIRVGLQIAQSVLRISSTLLQSGVKIEDAFAGIAKAATNVVDASGQLTDVGERVREQFLILAQEVPLAVEELLRIGELGAQLDIPDEYLAEFTRVVAAITKATVLSAEDAALGIGKIASVMNVATEDIERMGSVLVWLGNNMGIVEDEILLMGKRITGVAKTAGFATDEVLAISAAILRLGATPYAGASAVQQAITRITVALAEGSDDLELFAAVAGMTSEEFTQVWRAAPADAFIEFIKGLSLAGEDAVLLLDELGLSNIRVTQSFLSAAAAPNELVKALDGSRTAWEQNTALAREAQIRYETVASRIQLLKNQVDILGDSFFRLLRPAIVELLDAGTQLAELVGGIMATAFGDLTPVVEELASWMDELVEAIAPKGFRGVIDEMFGLAEEDISSRTRDLLSLDYMNLESMGSTGRWRIESALRNIFEFRFVDRAPRGGELQSAIDDIFDFEVPDDISERFLNLSRIEEGIPDFSSAEERLVRLNEFFDLRFLRTIQVPEVTGTQDEITNRFMRLGDSFSRGVSTVTDIVNQRFFDLSKVFDLRFPGLLPDFRRYARRDVSEGLIDRFGLEFDPDELTEAFEDDVDEVQEGTEDIVQTMFRDTQRIKIGARRRAIAEAFEEMYGFDMRKLTRLPSVIQRIIIAVHNLTGIEYRQLFGLIDIWERIRTGISNWLSSLDFTGIKDMISDSVGGAIQWFIDNWPKIEEKAKGVIDAILGYDWAGLWDTIKTAAGGVVQWFIDHWEPDIKPKILAAFDWVVNYDWAGLWKTITDNGQLVIDWFVDNWPTIKTTVIDTYNAIMDFLFGPEEPLTIGGRLLPGAEMGATERRIGGFINGLIAGFDEFKQSITDTADRIETELIPAIQQIIENVAVMLGMDPEEAMDPFAAGKFTIKKLGEVIEAYERIYEAIFKVIEYVTRPSTQKAFEFMVDPFGAALRTGMGIAEEQIETPLSTTIAAEVPSFPEEEEWTGFLSGIVEAIDPELIAALGEITTFVSDTIAEFLGLKKELVGESIIPDMMAAIVTVFETGFAEISTLWDTFWGGLTTGASTETDSFLAAMGVKEGGSSQGLLATIERSYSAFKDAGRGIVRAIADGMLEAAFMMVDALRENIDALNVAVDTDEAINDILGDIGYKITKKIADAIIKSYRLIYDALALALALGGGLVNQARAAAQEVSQGGGGGGGTVARIVDGAQQVVTNTAGAVTAPTGGYGAGYTPVGLPQPTAQGEAAQINITNYVRDDMDLAAIESSFRRIVAEEIA